MKPVNLLLNSRGQSLIQVMVAVAIMGIIMAAMISSQMMQSRANLSLNEKLSSLDLLRLVSQTESSSDACTALLTPANLLSPASVTFNASQVSATNPQVIKLHSIPGFAGSPTVLTENSIASPMTPTLFVPTGGIELDVTGPSSAELKINFDQSRLVQAVHNLDLRVNLQSTGPLANTTIKSCQGGNRTPMIVYTTTDFSKLVGKVTMAQVDYNAVVYQVPLIQYSFDQYLLISVMPVWNVNNCDHAKAVPPYCALATEVSIVTNGVLNACGSNSSWGSSGPYSSLPGDLVTCLVKIPAGATASVYMVFDARGGGIINFNPGTYTPGYSSPTMPVLTVYSLQ